MNAQTRAPIIRLIDVCPQYRDKMDEYRRVADRDPTNTNAVNLFAEAQTIAKAFRAGVAFASGGGRLQ